MTKPYGRKDLRLQGYDYSQPGFYFITICTKDKRCLLGCIKDFQVSLSPTGSVAERCWLSLPIWFPGVTIDEFVIMPNHVHSILQIDDRPQSLKSIIGTFKSAVTRLARQEQTLTNKELWQRGYFDHIVRSDQALFRLRKYIADNPAQWQLDALNPERFSEGTIPDDIDIIQEYHGNPGCLLCPHMERSAPNTQAHAMRHIERAMHGIAPMIEQ